MKQKEHLPIFGVGPFLIGGIGAVTAVFVILFFYILGIGILSGVPSLIMRIIGVLRCILHFAGGSPISRLWIC